MTCSRRRRDGAIWLPACCCGLFLAIIATATATGKGGPKPDGVDAIMCLDYTGTAFDGIVTYRFDNDSLVGTNPSHRDAAWQTYLGITLSAVSEQCANASIAFLAASQFPRCNAAQTLVLPPCRSLCQAQELACTASEQAFLRNNTLLPQPYMVPVCTTLSTASCNAMPPSSITADLSTARARCEPYDSQQLPIFKDILAADGAFSMWLPALTTQASLQRTLSTSAQQVIDGIQDDACRLAFARLVAGHATMKCDTSSSTFARPRLPCRTTTCDAFITTCANAPSQDRAIIEALFGNRQAINCARSALFAFAEDWPAVQTSFPAHIGGGIALCTNPPAATAQDVPKAQCVPYEGTACRGVIRHHVYLPAGMCFQDVESQFDTLPGLLGAMPAPGCAQAAAAMVCNQAFPRCDNTTFAEALATAITGTQAQDYSPIPLPRFPDQSLCTQVATACPGRGQYVALENGMGEQGEFRNFSLDATYIELLLQDPAIADDVLSGTCVHQRYTLGLPFPDFPAAPTTLGMVPGSSVPISTPTNTGSVPLASVVPPQSKCEPFNSTLIREITPPAFTPGTRTQPPFVDVPRSYCEGFIDEGTSVYVPYPFDLGLLNARARSNLFLQSLLPTGGSFDGVNTCMVAFTAFVCATAFMPCNTDVAVHSSELLTVYPAYPTLTPTVALNYSVPIVFPKFPCNSVCENVRTQCGALVEGQIDCSSRTFAPPGPIGSGELGTKWCNGSVRVAGQMDYPLSSTFFADFSAAAAVNALPTPSSPLPAVSLVARTQCNAANAQLSLRTRDVDYTCPYPLHDLRRPDRYGRYTEPSLPTALGGCAVACPGPFYSDEVYDPYLVVLKILAPISFLLLIYVLTGWYSIPSLRSRTKPLIFIVVSLCYSSVLFLSVYMNPDRMVCDGPARATQVSFDNSSGTICTISAMFINCFGVMSSHVWFVIVLELWVRLNWPHLTKKQWSKIDKGMYAWIFTMPVISVFVTFGETEVGNFAGIPYCAFTTPWMTDLWISIPLTINVLGGLLLMIHVVYRMHFIAKLLQTKEGFAAALKFAYLSFFTQLGILVFILDQRVHADDWQASIESWITCLVQDLPANIAMGNVQFACPDRPSGLGSPIVLWLNVLSFMPGFFIFGIYGGSVHQVREEISRAKKAATLSSNERELQLNDQPNIGGSKKPRGSRGPRGSAIKSDSGSNNLMDAAIASGATIIDALPSDATLIESESGDNGSDGLLDATSSRLDLRSLSDGVEERVKRVLLGDE